MTRAADWQPELLGPSLRLRPLLETDRDALFAAASDPLIWDQHPDRERSKPERFEVYFRSGLESRGALLALDRASGEALGSSRFRDHRPAESSVEIGYTFLTRACWGGTRNAELKRLMLDHAFRFVELARFLVGPENLRSRRAMLKLGASEHLDSPAGPDGPRVEYRIRRADWLARG